MADLPDHFEVAARVIAALEGVGATYVIGGSLASAFAGEPRSTIDVDFVVALDPQQVTPLLSALAPEFYVPEAALRRAVETRGSANLIHQDSQIKVDIYVAGGTPLDAQQLARRRPIEPRPGLIIYVYTPEDILLQKLRWYRKGGEVSDRQWRDILGIIRTQGEALDRTYLEANAHALDVESLLDRALDEAGAR
jgi:hypothetical protein